MQKNVTCLIEWKIFFEMNVAPYVIKWVELRKTENFNIGI